MAWRLLLVVMLAWMPASPAWAIPSFLGLGAPTSGSQAWGVSSDGKVVVGGQQEQFNEAFRWTIETGRIGIGELPSGGTSSTAWGVSGDGSAIVGRSLSSIGSEPFVHRSVDGMIGLGMFPGANPSFAQGEAYAASADGAVVVGVTDGPFPQFYRAFRWTASEGLVDLGSLGGSRSDAYAVSADGSVIVGQSGIEAFRWTQATGMIGLGDLPGGTFNSRANGISADGSVIVGTGRTAEPNGRAFRWTQATGMVNLGLAPGANGSNASDVSANGEIIVGTSETRQGLRAMIWDSTRGTRDLQTVLTQELGLDLAGWQLSAATGISDDGMVIVGYGSHAGRNEAWIATIPEPSPALLLAWGLAVIAARRRALRVRATSEGSSTK